MYRNLRIIIINGPNLNLLGRREPDIYGHTPFEDIIDQINMEHPEVSYEVFQSNIEGEIVSLIQKYGYEADGIILNAAAYTHTSIAIRDAISAVDSPVVEVHISNIYAREDFRHKSMIAPVCLGQITGFGPESYRLAAEALIRHCNKHL